MIGLVRYNHKIRFQVTTQVQDDGLLGLLAFLSGLQPYLTNLRSDFWSAGSQRKVPAFSPGAIPERLKKEQFNEMNFTCDIEGILASAQGAAKLRGSLLASPTSSKWTDTSKHRVKGRGERTRMTHEGWQVFVKRQNATTYPSLLEMFIFFDEPEDMDVKAVESIVGLFKRGIDQIPAGIVRYATLDIDRSGMHVLRAVREDQSERLGDVLDGLHDIVVVSRYLADGIRSLVPPEAITDSIPFGENVGVVLRLASITPKMSSVLKANGLLAPYEGPPAVMGPLDRYHTLKEDREAREAGKLFSLPPDWMVFPLMQTKYCEMLKIDPDTMLVDVFMRDAVASAYSDVDRKFEELPELPLRLRIREAHRSFFENIYFAHLPAAVRVAFLDRFVPIGE